MQVPTARPQQRQCRVPGMIATTATATHMIMDSAQCEHRLCRRVVNFFSLFIFVVVVVFAAIAVQSCGWMEHDVRMCGSYSMHVFV